MKNSELAEIAKVRQLAISGRARQIRIDAGVLGVEMAATVGVTNATLSRWESGLRTPSAEDALRWGRSLKMLERLALAGATSAGGPDAAA